MTRRQLAVPLVAAALGSAVTAAALTATGTTTSSGPRQQGLLASSTGEGQRLSVHEIFERSEPSVVAVRARAVTGVASPFETAEAAGPSPGPVEDFTTGSGFVFDDDGHIVTSARVVSGVTDVQVTFSDLRTVPARVLGKDEETDLALLWVDPQSADLRPLDLGDSSAVDPGDRAVALGNPGGFGATAGTGTLSPPEDRLETASGMVLRDAIATDALIEPASAGGPLLDGDGRVIGVSSGLPAGDAGGYAVAVNTVKDVIEQLKDSHRLIRPYLGIRGRTTPEGVQVIAVNPGGPADQAGLQGMDGAGDVIEAIDGKPVLTYPELLAAVDAHQPGDSVRLTVLRDGTRADVVVTLAERPATVPSG